MNVYFLRHGEAGDASEWHGDDSLRPLTEDGVKRMKREAKRLHKQKVPIDVLISSPYTRAHQTAKAIAKAFDVEIVDDARLVSGCTIEQIADVLYDYRDQQHVWLVGHEPSWSTIIGQAIGGGKVQMDKGGLACIQTSTIRPLHCTLLWLATPELLGADD